MEGRALARCAFHSQPAFRLANELSERSQAETGSGPRVFGREEGLEDSVGDFRLHAAPAVHDADRDDLFLMESDALMMALLELKQFNIPAVPVHDALIIEDRPGVDTEHLARFALTRAYASTANARAVARVEVRSLAA